MDLPAAVLLVSQVLCARSTLMSVPALPVRTEPSVWIDPTVTSVVVRRVLKVLFVSVT